MESLGATSSNLSGSSSGGSVLQEYPDPNTYTVQTYLDLVRAMHIATSTNFDHQTFKQADALLQQFAKTHKAWEVSIQVLTTKGLSDKVIPLLKLTVAHRNILMLQTFSRIR